MRPSPRRVTACRGFLAVASLALSIVPAPARGGSCEVGELRVPSRASLCRRIVLGERGFVRIELNQEVLLEKEPAVGSGGNVRVLELGTPAFSAVIMRGVAGDAEGAFLVMGTMPAGDWRFRFVLNMKQTPQHVELPTGGYQIYLLGPKRATFELDLTQSPARAVKLTEIPGVKYVRRTLGTWDSTGQGAIWAGDHGPLLSEDGFGLTGIWAEVKGQLETTSGSCYYGPGAPAPPPATAFAPGCPWFSPNRESPLLTAFSQPSVESNLAGHVHVSWPLQPGEWSLGSWMTTSGVIERAEALGVWLEFEPDEPSK